MFRKVLSLIGRKFTKSELQINQATNEDLIGFLKVNREFFINFESKILYKSKEEVEKEFDLGIEILNLGLDEDFKEKKTIIFVPQKYELWPHLLLAIKLVKTGYKVHFLYFGWSKKIIEIILSRANYVEFQNLKFSDVNDYSIDNIKNSFLINMSESFAGLKTTVPSFSTVYLKKGCDLDYAIEFIVNHAFSFAGLKKSNVKRVIIDSEIENDFLRKIQHKLNLGQIQNSSIIKSTKIIDEIRELVSEAISDGAELHAGDAIINPREWPKNILLSNIKPEMRIFQKKFYGPVLMITSISVSRRHKVLNKILSMQPSQGIILFVHDLSEKIPYLSNKYEYVYRTSNKDIKTHLLHDHPSLEYLLNELKKLSTS